MTPSDLFYGGLARLLVKVYDLAGCIWAWRVVRLAHAMPFLAGAWAFGWVAGWFWAVPPITPWASAWIAAGLLAFLMGCTWLKEWRQNSAR